MDNYLILSAIISIIGINLSFLFLLINRLIMIKREYLFLMFKNIIMIVYHLLIIMLSFEILFDNKLFDKSYIYIILYIVLITEFLYKFKLSKSISILIMFLVFILIDDYIIKFLFINKCIFLYELYEMYKLVKNKKIFISRNTIKEAFDSLEDGILFVNKNMEPLLMNNKMLEIIEEFEICYGLGDTKLIKKINDNIKDSLIKSDNKTYLVNLTDSTEKYKGLYYQFIDVSNYFDLLEQLEIKNRVLMEKQIDLKKGLINIEETVTNNEVLKLRLKIHDVIGQRLSIIHTYIENNYLNATNINELKDVLKNIREDLVYEVYDIDEMFNRLKLTYELVNTKLHLKGKFPEDKKISNIFINIIREASTNAIRHSGAKNVYISIKEDKGSIYLNIENDGETNENEIIEGDGILGMKRAIKPYLGTLVINTKPRFNINIEVKKI